MGPTLNTARSESQGQCAFAIVRQEECLWVKDIGFLGGGWVTSSCPRILFFASVGLKRPTKHSLFSFVWSESLVLHVVVLRGEFHTLPSSPMIKINLGMVTHPRDVSSRERETSRSLGLPGNQPHHLVSSRPMRGMVSENKVGPSRWVK